MGGVISFFALFYFVGMLIEWRRDIGNNYKC
jgi:hypothetical protein